MIEAPNVKQEAKRFTHKPLPTLLRKHPFLAGLKARHLRILAANAMPVNYSAGEMIFRQGEPANRFYLLLTGQVSLESRRDKRQPVTIQTIGPGDVLGWSWLFEPYYWQFDARAVAPTEAIFLYGSRLREQCEVDHDLGYELMKRMAAVIVNRLQATRKRLT